MSRPPGVGRRLPLPVEGEASRAFKEPHRRAGRLPAHPVIAAARRRRRPERSAALFVVPPSGGVFIAPFRERFKPECSDPAAEIVGKRATFGATRKCDQHEMAVRARPNAVNPGSTSRIRLCFAEEARLGERKDHDFFAGCGADVMVQAHHLDAGDVLDHRLDEGGAVSIKWDRTSLSRSLPFADGSDLTRCFSAAVNTPSRRTTMKISEQVGMNVLGAAAHVILLETSDPLADGGFDLSLRLHRILQRVQFLFGGPHRDSPRARRGDKSTANCQVTQRQCQKTNPRPLEFP